MEGGAGRRIIVGGTRGPSLEGGKVRWQDRGVRCRGASGGAVLVLGAMPVVTTPGTALRGVVRLSFTAALLDPSCDETFLDPCCRRALVPFE
jgi:hypothetical protein